MTDYMLIQYNASKVYLKTADGTPYSIPLGNITIEIDPQCEMWLVYHLYSNDIDSILSGFRNWGVYFSSADFDRFIERLKDDHPAQQIKKITWGEGYRLCNVPAIATQEKDLVINLPWLFKYQIHISYEQEREILAIAASNVDHRSFKVMDWFRKYREANGLSTYNDKYRDNEDYQLTYYFLSIHGISFEMLNEMKVEWYEEDQWGELKNIVATGFFIIIACSVYFGLCTLMMVAGEYLMYKGSIDIFSILGLLLFLGGGVLLFYPFGKLYELCKPCSQT